jgi:hypothetical protein
MFFADGRRFSYVLAGATTLISGDLIEGKPVVSGDYETVVTDVAPAIGDTSISLTTTTTTAANYYDGGWAHCNKATTLLQGNMYRIKASDSHAIFVAEAGHVVQLDPVDPIRVVGTTASEFGLVPNEFRDVVIAATTLVNRVIGVAQAPITNAQYGYVQTWGMCALQAAASQIVGNAVAAITGSAGRGGVQASPGVLPYVGVVLNVTNAAGEEAPVFLTIE